METAARIETALSPSAVVERVSVMSRRGRLPGLRTDGEGLFSTLAYGWSILDQTMVCEAEEGDGTVLRFRTVLPRKMPAVILAVFAFTVWPGVWLTHQMLVTYWGWYLGLANQWPWITYAWYLPMTVLPIPFIFRTALRRSHAGAAVSANELIERIGKEIGGTVKTG